MNVRTRITVLLFTSLIILASQISLSFAPYSSPKTVAASGTIVYPYVKSTTILKHLVVYSYTINDSLAAFIASHFDLVSLGVYETIGWQKIKQANPNITIITYFDALYMNDGSTGYGGADWAMVNSHEDWFLHDINGNRIDAGSGNWAMDVGSSGWRNYVAGNCVALLNANPLVNGIFLDDVYSDAFLVYNWGFWGGVQVADSVKANWNNNMAGLIQHVKNALGHKLLIINSGEGSGAFIKLCDGQMIENIGHAAWEGLYDYSRNVVSDLGGLETLSASAFGKIVVVFSGADIPQNPSASDIEQTHKVMLYCLSTLLLGYSGNASFSFQFLQNDYTGHRCYWEEMDYPVGNPVGSRYNIQGDLWTRDFTKGKVFLNVGDVNTYTVNVAGINYSVAPRSGLIVPS